MTGEERTFGLNRRPAIVAGREMPTIMGVDVDFLPYLRLNAGPLIFKRLFLTPIRNDRSSLLCTQFIF